MVVTMPKEEIMNCTINHEIHQYLFSCVYIIVLLVSVHTSEYLNKTVEVYEYFIKVYS